MVVVGALNGYLKFEHKNTFHGLKAYSLHFPFIIIYQELERENMHENLGSLASLQWIQLHHLTQMYL